MSQRSLYNFFQNRSQQKKFKALTLEQERGLHGSLARWAPDHIIFGPIFGLGLRRNDEAVGRGEVAPGEGGNDV